MSDAKGFDAAVIGGGIMGCTTALHLAQGGMRIAVLDRGPLCRAASGANPGTLSMQTKRAALLPYALKGWELWKTAPRWLGMDMGFSIRGGLTLAFNDEDAALLEAVMEERRAAGAPIEIIGANRARQIEPGLSRHVTLASYCAIDGYANSTLTGKAFRAALEREGVDVREGWSVEGVERDGGGFALRGAGKSVRARRIVLAGGVWLKKMGAWLGIDLPVECRVPQVVVTERMGPVMGPIIGVANKLLTLKQAANGTILIGGGWPGIGDTDVGGIHAIPKSIVANVRLARHAIPAIGRARIMRTWLGLAAAGPDWLPLVGDLPGVADAFVIGAARSGFTHGPFLGKLLAQHILGREPEMPLFDPQARIGGPADPLLPGR